MFENDSKKLIILKPGDTYISTGPAKVWTVLGSCVSVILYSPSQKIGAMCHAQLPERRDKGHQCRDYCPNPCYKELPENGIYKYVTCAIRFMMEKLTSRGVSTADLEASLFGGANRFNIKITGKSVGEENQEIAKKMLSKYNIVIKNVDIGGKSSRKIEFDAGSGKISVTVNNDS